MEQKNSQTIFTTSSHDNNILDLFGHYQFENGSSQVLFLDVNQNEKGGTFLNHSLSFSVENFVQTLASCNGLILFSGYSIESIDQSCYYVFNPLTKQSTMIPQPCIQGYVVSVGLASNDDNNQFKIVLIEENSSKLINGLEFHIFSSDDDTNKWNKVSHYIDLTLPSLPEIEFKELSIHPLYSNGSIHWEIGGYLLVYNVEKNNCELIELPNFFEDWSWQSTMTYRRCLCESRGRVYYCYTDFDGFHIWELLKKNHNLGLGPFYDSKKLRWKLVHSVMHEFFLSKHQVFCDTLFKWEPYKIAPIAYSEKAQTIYLQIPGAVVGYNFDTRNLRSICRYSYQDMNFSCCSFFSTFASGTHNVLRGKDLVTNGEIMELNLPIGEIEKLSF
ncbi:unnamed protein product [Trifolium pratense]|uniref:Uncharacterized protein n=1 Tax=Trifolium pratense TaxID=57577 RepID=A0ACB0J6M6_TRIPR|nr:unnamed protein product [Trifolium pratense]